MRRIADLHPGEAKTDARDAAIIAETARTMPHTLRSIQVADEQVAELTMLCGFDDDLAGQITQVSNRIRGLLTQIHPALERVLGPPLDHPAILDLLQHYPSPAAMKAAGEKRLGNRLLKNAPRKGRIWATEIIASLGEQTVVVTGANAAALVLPRLAEQLAALRRQRDDIAAEVENIVNAHPLQPVLTSMPGVGVRTAARLLTEITTKTFPTAGHLAATPDSPPSPDAPAPRSAANTHRDAATRPSSGRCSSPHSPRSATLNPAPTTTARSPKASGTTRPSSPSQDAVRTSSSPCSATAPSTSHAQLSQPSPLDRRHRGTPRSS
tara:strand:+ start:117 stop:1088 length:972 start_codon:yes stop_codon:yes gene_type:complete